MDRRVFFAVAIPGAASLGIWVYSELFPSESDIPPPGPPKIVSIVEFSDSGSRIEPRAVSQILKSDREWRRQLTYLAFQVTRKSATEIPYTPGYWNLHEAGYIAAFAAIPPCSPPKPSLSPVPDGPVSGNPSRTRTSRYRRIIALPFREPRSPAHCAMRTWATFSTTARIPLASVTA